MVEVVRQAEEATRCFGHKAMHRLVVVEEARPRRFCHRHRYRRRADALVEGVVALPQRQPLVEVASTGIADFDVREHGFASLPLKNKMGVTALQPYAFAFALSNPANVPPSLASFSISGAIFQRSPYFFS
jgi:hypothetical protein